MSPPHSAPQLLINYGICNDDNPFDSMPLTVSIAQQDPLFSAKRTAVQKHGLSTRVDFKLLKNAPLPQHLLPYLRLAHAKTAEEVAAGETAQHGLQDKSIAFDVDALLEPSRPCDDHKACGLE